MGFIAPFIAPVAGAIGSLWASHKAGQSAEAGANQLNQQGQAAFTGTQQTATNLTGAGNSLISGGAQTTARGLNAAGQGANYYSALLGGNRALQTQATAAPRAALTDVYRGAERGLEHSGVRGAARDVASADLNRDRAGKIAGLVTGVQPGAADALTATGLNMAGVGGQQTGQGLGAVGHAGSLLSGLYGPSVQQGLAANQRGAQAGKETGGLLGGLLFDIINGTAKRGSGSKMGVGGPAPWAIAG